MNTDFTACLLTCTKLGSTRYFFDFIAYNRDDSLANNSSGHFTNANRSHTWHFVQSNQSAGCEATQTIWIHVCSGNLLCYKCQACTEVVRSKLEGGANPLPEASISTGWSRPTVCSQCNFPRMNSASIHSKTTG